MKKLLFTPLLVLFMLGCVRERDYQGKDGGSKLSVRDAQSYSEENATEFEPINLLYTGDNKVATRSVLPQIVLTPNWDEATAYENDGAAIVDVPILSNAEQSIRVNDCKDGRATQVYRLKSENRLVILNSNGVDLMFVLTLIPDEHSLIRAASEVRFMHPNNDFDGLAMLSNLDGTIECVLDYNGGKPSQLLDTAPYQSLSEEELRNLGEHIVLHASTYLQESSTRILLERYSDGSFGTIGMNTAVVVGRYGGSGGGSYGGGGMMGGGGMNSGFMSGLGRAWAEMLRLYREAQEQAKRA